MQDILKIFQALSEETRLRIINLILERECSVCEIMQAMRISQTRASRGLTILHNAGILKLRRDGLWVLYSINEEGMERYYDCLTQLITSATKNNELADLDRERLKATIRESPCVARAKLLAS